MCGIAGFIDASKGKNVQELTRNVTAMTEAIFYRGPDGAGHWVDPENGVALGHRRLAIVDLTDAGFQPMISRGQRFILTYNGEIYNSPLLREILGSKGCSFKGHSDTEVMLAAFCEWGIVESLKKMVGMFAFAVWDTQEKSLWLGRDRLGKKPLYYGWQGNILLFASDLHAFRASCVEADLKIDRSAMASFHQWAFIPSPYSMYQGVQKLKPGTVRVFRPADIADFTLGTEEIFWDLTEVVRQGIIQRSSTKKSFATAVEETENLLHEAVKSRMMADVPLGGFLSGGIDSSLIIALMQQHSEIPIQTFAIGFSESKYDESTYAEKVAHHLGTNHKTVIMTAADALDVIQDLPNIYDEPFADASQLPTVLVSRLAARSVKVVVSGDGGDEVFAGYTRYLMSSTIHKIFNYLPYGLRTLIATIIRRVPTRIWRIIEPVTFIKHLENKMSKAVSLLQEPKFEGVYTRLLKRWNDENIFKETQPHSIIVGNPFEDAGTPIDWMQYHDTLQYLVDDILVKVDRATMAASIEARCPFLDHRLIEYVWGLPLEYKIHHGKGKLILRKILGKYVPQELFERPKMGFGIPVDAWLKGPLREWADSLLDPKILEERGYHSQLIRQQWKSHCEEGKPAGDNLWMVLMAQLWENNLKK